MRTSVLINTYNQAAFLGACVESVLAQTQPADEIVVYDDGSSDNSMDVLQSFRGRISVIEGARVARPSAINQGNAIHQAFLHSTGDLVFLLDGDDVFLPSRIAAYTKAFAQTPRPVLVQSPLGWMDSAGQRTPRLLEPFRHTATPLVTTYRLQDPDLFYPTSALAFDRAFLQMTLPIDWSDRINLWSDTRLCLAALLAGPIVTLSEEHGVRRNHTRSDSATAARFSAYQLVQTWRRARVFNRLCRKSGRAPISVWQNPRFYLQLLRLIAPGGIYRAYEMSVATRRQKPRRTAVPQA